MELRSHPESKLLQQELLSRMESEMRRLSSRFSLGSRAIADDCFSEAAIAVLKSAATYDQRLAGFKTYSSQKIRAALAHFLNRSLGPIATSKRHEQHAVPVREDHIVSQLYCEFSRIEFRMIV